MSGYYVTVTDGPRVDVLVGPLRSHEAALARVDAAKAITVENVREGRAYFYAYGTSRWSENTPPGKLNGFFGLAPA